MHIHTAAAAFKMPVLHSHMVDGFVPLVGGVLQGRTYSVSTGRSDHRAQPYLTHVHARARAHTHMPVDGVLQGHTYTVPLEQRGISAYIAT